MRLIASLILLACVAMAQQPNVLVIVADDLGWPERPLLPSLDALAAHGVTFTRAYSQPVCTITRLEFMFGALHRRQGIGENIDAFTPGDPELPLALTSTAEGLPGYSAMLIGKWHLGRVPGSSQVQSGPPAQGWGWRAGAPSLLNSQAIGYFGWWRAEDGALAGETTYATDAQLASFAAWWTTTPGPKLCYLCWSAPHKPWDVPPGGTAQTTNRARYEDVVRYLDGALAAALGAVSLADTFVIFTSDNGTPETAYPVGSPPGIWKGTTFEGGVRVPMIVAGPGISQGVTTQRVVSMVDLPATIAELVGVASATGWLDSQSFADELGVWGGGTPRAFVFAELYSSTYDDQAVIESKWKLRRVNGADYWYRITAPGTEVPLVPPAGTQARLIAELASLPARVP